MERSGRYCDVGSRAFLCTLAKLSAFADHSRVSNLRVDFTGDVSSSLLKPISAGAFQPYETVMCTKRFFPSISDSSDHLSLSAIEPLHST